MLKSRRLCYLKTILDRDPDELIAEIYDAQKVDPTPGDFAEQVEKDGMEVSLDIHDENVIKSMKMEKFKIAVKLLLDT